MAQSVKTPPAMKETSFSARDTGLIPGSGISPGGETGKQLQYFSWEMPRTEEPGGLESIGLQSVGHD